LTWYSQYKLDRNYRAPQLGEAVKILIITNFPEGLQEVSSGNVKGECIKQEALPSYSGGTLYQIVNGRFTRTGFVNSANIPIDSELIISYSIR
jgi:hypothetical protein